MFRADDLSNVGFLSILFAEGEEPLAFWDKQVRNGRIKRMKEESDKEKFLCLELSGMNVNSTFISSPPSGSTSLGITLPVLVLIIKNLKKYFCYQVQILDDKRFRRRFRLTNIPGFNRRQATVCTFPLALEDGWNELSINLAELCSRCYGTQYVETIRMEIHANCRLREVFFCERFDAMKTRVGRPMDIINIPTTSTEPKSSEESNNNQGRIANEAKVKMFDQQTRDKKAEMAKYNEILEDSESLLNSNTTSLEFKPNEDSRKTENSGTISKGLSLAERLKKDMYFEKADTTSNHGTSQSRRSSKSRKK